ncbi:MAG TPA: fasciclin domain-containing protein [Thermoanaerobaculia bacterium]|nr:fasciclin domain-containing protein [Thermoanaerobaculia bacterium]
MTRKILFPVLSVLLLAGSALTAQAANAPAKGGDIVDTAVAAGSFNTLVKAVQAAGLVETLKGPGPFTVFAPTDEAFAKLPPGALDALLKDKAKLQAVLTYHVVPGRVTAADVMKLKTAKTVQGQSLRVDSSKGVKIGTANVVKTDVIASNGVIHVIDTVLIPD